MSESEFPLDGSHLFRPETVGLMLAQQEQAEARSNSDEERVEVPDELPILPLRGVVVYPLTVQQLTVGQPRSVRLIDEAVVEKKLVGLLASKDPELEEPTPDD